jgi:hypothetical protein
MSSIVAIPTLFQVLSRDNTTGANNIIVSDGTNYIGFGTSRSTDGYIRTGKSFSIHGLNASNANITLLDLVASQVQIGSNAVAGVAVNSGTDIISFANSTRTLATLQTSTVTGQTSGAELAGNTNSFSITADKLFFKTTNPSLGGKLNIAFSNNDPEVTPAFTFGDTSFTIHDNSTNPAKILKLDHITGSGRVISSDSLQLYSGGQGNSVILVDGYTGTNHLSINANGLTFFGGSALKPKSIIDLATCGLLDSNYNKYINLTNQAGTIGTTTILTSTITGVYSVFVYLVLTTAGTSGTVSATILTTDASGGPPATFSTANVTFGSPNRTQACFTVAVPAGNTLDYAATVTSPVGNPRYQLQIVAIRVA